MQHFYVLGIVKKIEYVFIDIVISYYYLLFIIYY